MLITRLCVLSPVSTQRRWRYAAGWPAVVICICLLFAQNPAFAQSKPNPEVKLGQSLGPIAANGDGSFSVEVTLTVRNTGNEKLVDLQIKDDLDIFGPGSSSQVGEVRVLEGNLTLNPGYDGWSDIRLLTGKNTLQPGQRAKLRFKVTIDPGNSAGPFTNRAIAWAEGEGSGIGVDNRADCTFSLPLRPAASFTKTASDVIRNPDGTYTVSFTLDSRNTGTEDLILFQFKDDLDIFGSGNLVFVTPPRVLDGNLTLNPAYDGINDVRLLDGSDLLRPGERARVQFDVIFDAAGDPRQCTNRALVWTEGKQTGIEVDFRRSATFDCPPALPLVPAIALDKQASLATDLGNGEFSSQVTLTVRNTGNEVLNGVQVVDPLDIFGSGQLLRVDNLSSPTLTVNPGYDGTAEASLLAGTDSLAIGETGTISFTIVFAPGSEPGPFLNSATSNGMGEDSGLPVDASAEAGIDLPQRLTPDIELVQTAGAVSANSDGSESVQITLTVTNTGTEALVNVQLADDLNIFGNGQLLGVESLESDVLTINPLFDGYSSTLILSGTDSLAVGETAAITFVIQFGRGPEPGPFTNVVTADAVGQVTGGIASDSSEVSFGEDVIISSVVIAVTKVADRTQAARGDIVGYDVTVINLTSNPLGSVLVTDTPPAGFEFVQGSALLIRAGTDGILGSPDDDIESIGHTGSGAIEFDTFDLAPNESVIVRYATLVGVGVGDGEHVNSVVVSPPPFPPVSADAPVTVVRDPIFEKTTVIGKVFNDRNGNMYPDPDEPGIPGVRLATVAGLTMETDAEGRYHLADVDVERFERGANFIIKVDEASLPDRARIISENPRVIRLTQATMSKINFAVGSMDPPEGPCFHSCLTLNRQRVKTIVDPVRFVSGIAEIPEDFAQQLRDVLRRHRDKRDASIVLVGHADWDPVIGRLAARLDASGEAGNVVLSRNRAMNVCRIARDELNVPIACDNDNVTGVGSSRPIATNLTPEGKALNRRVEIEIEYSDSLLGLQHELANAQACLDQDAGPYQPDWFENLFSLDSNVTIETQCILHTGPLPDAETSANARLIMVSGGNFGCHTLVAEALPGRDIDGKPGIDSEVTIYASTGGNAESSGTTCSGTLSGNIVAGRYPIEVRTGDGSAILVTGAGDVQRAAHPQNPNDFEHIVVTPIRDDTDQTIITALRVTNDGIEPLRGRAGLQSAASSAATLRANADSRTADPRLDVMALGAAQVDDKGLLEKPINFAVFSNYDAFINRYALEIYGRSANGPGRKLLETLSFTEWQFDEEHRFPAGRDLSDFDQLEYVLTASNCGGEADTPTCYLDRTRPRVLPIQSSGEANDVVHEASEIWGKTNLEVQRIPVRGGKVRVHCPTPSAGKQCRIDKYPVPEGHDGSKVLEEHLAAGTYSYRNDLSGTVFGLNSVEDRVDADASDIVVSGGMFGCGEVRVGQLPGRESRSEIKVPAVTVFANRGVPLLPDSQCGELSAVTVSTGENTVLKITGAGDVRPERYPLHASNLQQIVVTPFRDYTDPTVVSAMRIVNEGLHYDPRENPLHPASARESVTVDTDYQFLVALANLTIGQNNLTGNAAPLSPDAHFDGSTFVDGRLALYGKRKTEKYSLTAQLDSTEDELRNFTDNLRRKDPRRIFRQLDPNRYYPVYGDDSTTTTDVDTQGAFYLRVDWDKNTALWGNYNTGITDTEFMQYNRSLYGAKLQHESRQATKFGDAKTGLTVFGSEAQSAAAHVTFQATGGSLYYLRDTDIVMGSEKVWVEVRRRDTQQVVEREILFAGRDYEIDALQGRIILRQPLSQVVNDRRNSIIRSAPLEGDEVFLLVDYEYVPPAFSADDMTYGGRGHAWLGDYVGIGVTAITDERTGTDYEMTGFDLTFRASEGSYLRAEIAGSAARQNDANFLSPNGGLSFTSQVSAGPGDSLDGDALALEGRIDLADISEALQGDIHAWSKRRDADFSTGRLGQGENINDSGLELLAGLGSNVTISARFTDFEREQVSRERVTSVQADGTFGRLQAGLEVRHEDVDVQAPAPAVPVSGLNAGTSDGEAVLVGGRLGYDLGDDTMVYAAAQTVASDKGNYAENDLVSIGVNTRMNDELAVSLEVSDGDRGSALIGGVDYAADNGLNLNLSGGIGSGAVSQFATRYAIGDGHELYGSYAVDPDRTEGARNLLTLGQRRAFGNSLDIFAESQFGKDDRYANVAHVFGMNFDGSDDWRYSASVQFSENDSVGLQFDRRALSFGAYRTREDLKFSTRVEYREDEGTDLHNRQYVSSSSFTWFRDESSRWLGLLNFSWTDDELNGGRDARFAEFDIGYAWRPVANDRFNLIGKYSFLYDLPTEGQATIRPDEKSHLVSVEGIYDLGERWELAGKLAARRGERRSLRDAGPWQDFGLRLASVRARYHLTHKWDALAEYRWLSDIEGNGDRHGALLGVYRHVGENFKVGVGFNFTDFDDRLRVDSYRNRGWFVDLVGKY